MAMKLDPSQLVALSALLEEGHVTRAARRLGMTQSSMSHRLAQLREALGDPLFVRAGAKLALTPRAEAIRGPLSEALRALARSIEPEEPFDPKAREFTVCVAMPDLLATLVPRLRATLSAEAPRVRVRIANIVPELSSVLALDPPSMALVPTRFLNDEIRSQSLPELHFGVLGRKGHPAFRRRLTTSEWLAHPHITVRIGNEPTNLIEEELRDRGLERRVGLEVPSFLAGLLAVSQSNLLMNAPMPLVNDAAKTLGLRLVEAPIALPRVRFALAWHPRFDRDPAQRWARARVYAEMRSALAGRPRPR